MQMYYYIDFLKLMLTGDILQSEISDDTYIRAVNAALQELNRYYNVSQLINIGYSTSCIDLAKIEEEHNIKINFVANIYRTEAIGSSNNSDGGLVTSTDPTYASYWTQCGSYYLSSYKMYDYLSYNLANRLQNTTSTDLSFTEDQINRKLYVNFSQGDAANLTLDVVPVLENVEQINGNYWIDILRRMSLAYLKIILGRVRTRYTQSNALWTQDGEKLLQEGAEALNALRERLQMKADFTYPVD